MIREATGPTLPKNGSQPKVSKAEFIAMVSTEGTKRGTSANAATVDVS